MTEWRERRKMRRGKRTGVEMGREEQGRMVWYRCVGSSRHEMD